MAEDGVVSRHLLLVVDIAWISEALTSPFVALDLIFQTSREIVCGPQRGIDRSHKQLKASLSDSFGDLLSTHALRVNSVHWHGI